MKVAINVTLPLGCPEEKLPLRIAEIYRSVQGEGFLTGTGSVFVRTSGCNLRCWYCDTPHTSWQPEGRDLSVAEVVGHVARFGESHVVVTGGEPMLHAELIPLCEALAGLGLHITIETAGTLYIPVKCALMSISPKRANSAPAADQHPRWHVRHEQTRHAPRVMRQLISEYAYQLKFVVDQPEDVDDVLDYLDQFDELQRDRVMLMPQGVDTDGLAKTARWLIPRCAELGFHYCPRKQIEWFGMTRST